MRQRIVILGSTGSVGRNALEVVTGLGEEAHVVGLASGSRWEELAVQANRFRPDALAVARNGAGSRLREALAYQPTIFDGPDALERLITSLPCECVVSAVVGIGGLAATVRAVELGRRIALANKESLVIAGSLLMPLAKRTGAEILPIDSEHSAVFQALHAGRRAEVHKVYLTASGGPFRTWSDGEMDAITVENALRHPTWDMGPKVTIDSATMMNKALEIIEARWLFDLDPDQVAVLVHPESIVHALVEFCDGSMIAQLAAPDMRTPIQYALTFPHRRPCPAKRLNLSDVRQLNFYEPDEERFPAIRLGYDVARRDGTAGAVLNAANDVGVDLFREERIGFRDIARCTEEVLRRHELNESPTLDELLAADRWARDEVSRCTAC